MEGTLISLSCLAIAAFLDYAIGDPEGCLHPVQVMGWAIAKYTQFFWHLQAIWKCKFKNFIFFRKSQISQKFLERLVGIYLLVMLIGGSGLFVAAGIQLARDINQGVGLVLGSLTLASCLAGRGLRDAALAVLVPLQLKDEETARQVLSRYVGRDTAQLSTPAIYRAVLETVTENATDGVMAPLFYGLLGVIFWGLPGVGVAIAYKAASTLDSMIGYLAPPYTHIGWASAKLEDLLTWLPCRLHVLTLAVFSGRPREVLAICQRDAPQDPSPNSGWSECVYAAILGVQVGGDITYKGVVKSKPLLGNNCQPITEATIRQALYLTRYAFLLWLVTGMVLIFVGKFLTLRHL